MRRIEFFFLVVIISFFASIITYSIWEGNKRGKEFLKSEFRKQVDYVNYQHKIDCIHFIDGSDLSITLDFYRIEMKEYYGREFSEFIFPRDSIIKNANENWFTVKPPEKNSFRLYF